MGPKPCPVHELTSEILAVKFQELTNPETKANAVVLSAKMNAENGVQGGLQHFLDYLPRDRLLCDVSLVLGECTVSKYRLVEFQVTVGTEVAAMLAPLPNTPKTWGDYYLHYLSLLGRALGYNGEHWLRRNAKVTYALGNCKTIVRGCSIGCSGCWSSIFLSPFLIYTKPDKMARTHGAIGCLVGLCVAPFYIVITILYGIFVVFVDRVMLGCLNQCQGKNRLYFLDTSIRYKVYRPCTIVQELREVPRPNVARAGKLIDALNIAKAARLVFDSAEPHFPQDHFHWQVAPANRICKNISRIKKLKDDELAQVSRLLHTEGINEISFSRLCFYIGESVKRRESEGRELPSKRLSMYDLYGSAPTTRPGISVEK